MDGHDERSEDTETILMALDQISQTIEVMTSVVGKLRTFVEQEVASNGQQHDLPEDLRPDRVLH